MFLYVMYDNYQKCFDLFQIYVNFADLLACYRLHACLKYCQIPLLQSMLKGFSPCSV